MQHYLLQARQMQALSFIVHIPLVCFGMASIALAWLRRYGVARASAAVAVAAVLFGWAAAQRPFVLPGLTLARAAAGDATMIGRTRACRSTRPMTLEPIPRVANC
jgi:cyanate permease